MNANANQVSNNTLRVDRGNKRLVIDLTEISLENPINSGDYFVDVKRQGYDEVYKCDIGTTSNFVLTHKINFPIQFVRKVIEFK